jgi:hypothetical protein
MAKAGQSALTLDLIRSYSDLRAVAILADIVFGWDSLAYEAGHGPAEGTAPVPRRSRGCVPDAGREAYGLRSVAALRVASAAVNTLHAELPVLCTGGRLCLLFCNHRS